MENGLIQYSAEKNCSFPSSHWAGWNKQPNRPPWPGVTESLLGDLEGAASTVIHRL